MFAAFFVTLFPKPRRLVTILTDAAGGSPKVETERYYRKDKHAKDEEKDVCGIHFENLGYVLGGLSVWSGRRPTIGTAGRGEGARVGARLLGEREGGARGCGVGEMDACFRPCPAGEGSGRRGGR